MVHKLLAIFHKPKIIVVSVTVALAVSSALFSSIALPAAASADACDPVNIVYCGLEGSAASGYINSFQSLYQNGSNAGHDDLKAVFRWAGATNTSVANMSTANTKVGTLYRNGDIKVDGKVVGHDAWVAARFGDGKAGFVQISPGVWARKTTTSLEHDTYKTIVHFDAEGNADFAVMVDCGNAVKFTPVVQPKPVQPHLECVSLTQVSNETPLTYSFTATASAVATTIQSYTFTFTSGSATSSETINTSAKNLTLAHTFAQNNTTYTANVVVKGVTSAGFPVSAPACTVSITTPKPKECKPGIPLGDARCNKCKPGIPVGDDRCTECKPGIPAGSEECAPQVESASTLVNTGPGSVFAVFTTATLAGVLGRHLYLRNKL